MPIYEVASAAATAMLISPAMSIIDTSIIKSQISETKFGTTLSEVVREFSLRDGNYAHRFRIMFGVYFATFATSNLSFGYCESYGVPSVGAFALTSAVNQCCILYKDREFTKIAHSAPPRFPLWSYALFLARDALTIYASFIYKPRAIKQLENHIGHNEAVVGASFVLPVAAQILSTPLHILAVDGSIRRATLTSRLATIRTQYVSVCAGRILRVIPAFCVGGWLNDTLRAANCK